MPVVGIPEPTYKRLQAIARPFVDTIPVSVIERLIGEHEARGDQQAQVWNNEATGGLDVRTLDPDAFDELSHTRVLSARIANAEVRPPKWNYLVRAVHQLAIRRGYSVDSLARLTLSNIREGKHTDRGFHYLQDENISIQGVDAKQAWRNTLHLARDLNISIEVAFEWHNKEEAAYPGRKGRISWLPASN